MKQVIIITLLTAVLPACKKYLDAKPDNSVAIPSTLQDMQVLLDNQAIMNGNMPSLLEIPADDYYLTSTDWAAVPQENDRENYLWVPDAEIPNNWSSPYKAILYANTVLDNIDRTRITESNRSQWDNCKGQALFFRAYVLFHLAQIYCKPYVNGSSNNAPGVPLKFTAAIDEFIQRFTVTQVYEQIIADANASVKMLAADNSVKTRPNKAAAYGLLAKIYLGMQEYNSARVYADSCLQLYSQLIDFNNVSTTASVSFSVFNSEVIFHSNGGAGILNPSRCRIDSMLYLSYNANDLRKVIYFKNNGNGTYGFKGSYMGSANNDFFTGIATDEIWLIKAECLARTNDVVGAMAALNTLMVKRWKNGTFVPFTAANSDQALRIILTERRKELLFRGVRWQDLRRLNMDSRFSKVLTRFINGQTYQLPPDDLRYVMLIPSEVILFTGIAQNPR